MAVGSIEIDILANTSKLVKGMYRSEKTVTRSINNMVAAASALAAVFVGGAMLNKISATAAGLDKIGKTSSKLGITAEKLQGLHLAASEAGISTETFNMALQRMVRRVAEAGRGTGEAVGALNELNISAAEMAKLTPDEMLRRVADSMVNVTNESDRVRLAMKLFDSEGVSMVNMLDKGSKGLDDVAAKADKLGLIIGGNYIKAIERSNDAWNISKQVTDTVWKGITAGLSISLIGLIDDLNDGSEKIDVFSESLNLTKQVVYGAGRGFEILATSISTAINGYKLLDAWMRANNGETGSEAMVQGQKDLSKALIDNEVTVNAWKAALAGTSETAMALKKIMNTAFTGLDTEGINEKINKTNSDLASQNNLWRELGAASTAYYNKLNVDTTTAASLVSSLNSTISSGLTNSFRQAMDGATNFSDTFKNMAKDVIAQLIHILVVQKAVAAALSGLGFGGTAAPVRAGSVGVGGAMADGGIVRRGSSFLVGEDGPEIVSLPKGANVTPNGKAPAMSGSSVNINVINNAGAEVGIQEDSDGNIDIIVSKLANDVTRGTGPFSAAIERRYNLKKG